MAKLSLESRDAGVRVITLTDPERRNALGRQMGSELIATAAQLQDDPEARVVVVTGQGTAFCAGADLPELLAEPEQELTVTHAALQEYYRAFLAVLELPMPTIAAVNGPAVGAGLNLAMCCDLRVAGATAQFSATFARIGLHPGGGCTWFLVRALGASRALRTLLLGEPIDARRAVDWGLAEGPEEDPLAAATELAQRIAAIEPELARHIKRAVGLAVRTGDFGAVLEYESWAQAASTASPRLRAWIDRFR